MGRTMNAPTEIDDPRRPRGSYAMRVEMHNLRKQQLAALQRLLARAAPLGLLAGDEPVLSSLIFRLESLLTDEQWRVTEAHMRLLSEIDARVGGNAR